MTNHRVFGNNHQVLEKDTSKCCTLKGILAECVREEDNRKERHVAGGFESDKHDPNYC